MHGIGIGLQASSLAATDGREAVNKLRLCAASNLDLNICPEIAQQNVQEGNVK